MQNQTNPIFRYFKFKLLRFIISYRKKNSPKIALNWQAKILIFQEKTAHGKRKTLQAQKDEKFLT